MAIGRVGSGRIILTVAIVGSRVTGRVGLRVGRVRVILFFRVDSDFGSFGSRVGSGLGHLSFGLFRVTGRSGHGSGRVRVFHPSSCRKSRAIRVMSNWFPIIRIKSNWSWIIQF